MFSTHRRREVQAPASQERRLELSRAVNRLSDAILRADNTSDMLQSLVDIAGAALHVDRALIYDVRVAEELAVALCEWIRPDVPISPTKAVYPLRLFGSAANEIARTGAPLESSRTAIHPLLARDGADEILHGQMAIQRLLWFPFMMRPGGYYLLVFNQVTEDRPWRDEERDFVEVVAAQVSLAVMKSDLLRERERTESELRQSENRYRLLYDHTPSMFFTVDRNGVVRSVNRFAIEHLGYPAQELIGASVLKVIDPEDHAVVRRHLADCFADPGAVRMLHFRKVCKDGSLIWVKETVRVVESQDGVNALIVCEDVTESRRHEEAARQAQSAAHGRDDFMAMLGHELRNPLSPIVTAVEILRRRGNNDRELDVIQRQVAHLRRLVDDLLDVSRIMRGKVELNRERVELAVIAAHAVEMARPLVEQKRQVLLVRIARDGLAVDADPVRLAQVFSNLLTNAAKYSGEGTTIDFSAERQGDRILVRVRDQGVGIEPELLERVFDLFVQRRQSVDRAQSGLGLGLTIVRNLITLHGGTVRASSEGRGRGAELVVDLPAAAGAPQAPSLSPADFAADVARAAGEVGRILVVDDNEDAREMLCDALASLGYQVHGARDGASALEAAAQCAPEVALLDIGLPGMDGYELARRLRACDSALRLVALTGYGQESDRARSRQAGFDAHVVKPIELDTLQRLLANLLGR